MRRSLVLSRGLSGGFVRGIWAGLEGHRTMTSRDDIVVTVCGIIALIYLLNPTFGMFELIPDNLPIVGNLDEAAATAVVLYALRYFGIDLLRVVNNINRNRMDRGH